jgi:hypothetical protein
VNGTTRGRDGVLGPRADRWIETLSVEAIRWLTGEARGVAPPNRSNHVMRVLGKESEAGRVEDGGGEIDGEKGSFNRNEGRDAFGAAKVQRIENRGRFGSLRHRWNGRGGDGGLAGAESARAGRLG